MDNPKRVLLIQLKRAGDVVVTTPLLPPLRQALPEARIDFLVDKAFAPLLEHNPFINDIRIYDRANVWATWRTLRAASYDWILDFQSSPRSILAGIFSGARRRAGYKVPFWGLFLNHFIQRPGNEVSATEGKMNLVRSLFSPMGAPGERQIFLTDSERQWAAGLMGEGNRGKQAIGLVPTHRRPSRRWMAESFAALGRLFLSRGHPVWLFWGPGEEQFVSAIQRQIPESRMIPPASLRQMASLLERCNVVVTNDNGPMHLATAVGTPTVTIYGPTDPASWNPGGLRHRVIQATGLTCLGCNLNSCPFEHECMSGVKPERVFQEALHLTLGTVVGAR
jgi:ADP-heptose:LPS heptosyltransferase